MKFLLWLPAALLSLLVLLAIWSAWGSHAIEERFPAIGQFIEVNGQRLHYTDSGSRRADGELGLANDVPALLLIHGANSNLRDFQSSIGPLLADHFRVLAFDRPGYGYSERAHSHWQTPAEVADLLLIASERLGASRPLLLGHSWAGAVVMAAAVEYPDRIRGGVLLSAVTGHWAGSVGAVYEWGQRALIGDLMAYTVVYPYGRLRLEQAVVAVSEPDPVAPDYIEAIAAPLALRPETFRNNVEDMANLSEYMQSLSRRYVDVEVRMLAIHGEDDELVPFWNHGLRLSHVLPALQVHMIKGAGHAPHHAHAAEVSAAVTQFVLNLDQPAALANSELTGLNM